MVGCYIVVYTSLYTALPLISVTSAFYPVSISTSSSIPSHLDVLNMVSFYLVSSLCPSQRRRRCLIPSHLNLNLNLNLITFHPVSIPSQHRLLSSRLYVYLNVLSFHSIFTSSQRRLLSSHLYVYLNIIWHNRVTL